MKIGILTFWNTDDNYGQLLQCYALQTYLRSLGHETYLVRTNVGLPGKPTLKMQLMNKVRTVYRLREFPFYLLKRICGSVLYTATHFKLREHKTERGFEQFRQKYLNCTKIYTVAELEQTPPLADAFVVGSDQIWNSKDGVYYLSWAKDEVKKISYAASFGACDGLPDTNALSSWLSRFDHVSVREETGVGICKNAGRQDAVCVVDPTMLLKAEDYQKIAQQDYPKEKYLFLYILGTRTYINWKEIHAFARGKGLKIKYVCNNSQHDKFKHDNVTIHNWVSLMEHAEYVVTNSFHGTVFALTFGKKFIIFPIIGPAAKMNDRLVTLLTPLGLKHHIYTNSINVIEEEIDYRYVHSIMHANSERSRQLLKKWTC